MRHWIIAIVVVAAAPVAPAQQGAEAPGQPAPAGEVAVPVRRVVLFSSGVGYFEHAGPIQGNGEAQLLFKTDQINDLLKSLVLQDLDGGKVAAVTYPSREPLDKTLRSFGVDIAGNPSLAELLKQLRGAAVRLTAAGETLEGTVLGVEQRQVVPQGADEAVTRWVLTLLSGASVRQVQLEDVSELTFKDAKLQEELGKALAALAQARDQDRKPVTLRFDGEGERRVRVGYVVQAPVWKTSYRLILGGENDPAHLQGWAIVENQTDNDWQDVQLSLVSGRPISFVQNLYDPLYIDRPVVEPELYASLRPQEYGQGLKLERKENELGRAAERERRAMQKATGAPTAAYAEAEQLGEVRAQLDTTASVQSVAQAAEVGELFEYTIGGVALPRQKSAMLPIVTDPVEVERLSIYNQSVLARHPLNGARVKNTTDKHLLAGPITVFDGGSYAGDAQVGNLPPGQDRLLSYGIDLKTLVNASHGTSESELLTGKVVGGVLTLSRRHLFKQDYVVENKFDAPRRLLVEHPVRKGWELVNPPEPVETTQDVHRFAMEVPAGEQKSLTVRQQRVERETIALLPLDIEALLFYSRAEQIPQNVRESLAKAAQLKQKMTGLERQIEELDRTLNEITQDQQRIRENLRTPNIGEGYRNRLASKLDTQETQIGDLREQRDELQEQLEQTRKELEDYLNKLNVE